MFLHLLVFAFALATTTFGQGTLDLEPNDTMQALLQRQVGQAVELRMTSGEKIGGKLEKVTEKLVYLSQITGVEYFGGVVVIEHVAALVVRTKK